MKGILFLIKYALACECEIEEWSDWSACTTRGEKIKSRGCCIRSTVCSTEELGPTCDDDKDRQKIILTTLCRKYLFLIVFNNTNNLSVISYNLYDITVLYGIVYTVYYK